MKRLIERFIVWLVETLPDSDRYNNNYYGRTISSYFSDLFVMFTEFFKFLGIMIFFTFCFIIATPIVIPLLIILTLLYTIACFNPVTFIKQREQKKIEKQREKERKERERLEREEKFSTLNKELLKHQERVLIENNNSRMMFNNGFLPITTDCRNYEDFLDKFFYYNNHSDTYSSEDNPKLICTKSRRRSLGDIWLIVTYYFPETTMMEVLKYLVNSNCLDSSKCNTIKKYVFYLGQDNKHNSNSLEWSNFDFYIIKNLL